LTPCTATATGVGGLSQSVAPTYTNNTNAGTATANANFAEDANHTASADTKPFMISKATQAITWSNPADIIYGAALNASQLNATVNGLIGGSAPGALTYTPLAGTVLHAGARTLQVDASETQNYSAASKTVSINVLPATATVAISNLVQPFNGTTRSATITTTPANLSVDVSYKQNGVATTPMALGVYEVRATITNPDYVGSDTELFAIYDASAGFVTGGGWIMSPGGAYAADPTLTGKANFGFNSKYQKGANLPTGNTEFQFQAGNLNFSSTNFQWLVIQGTTKAQFKGTGTINGKGSYNFLVTAIDGDNFNGTNKKGDAFRIKITDSVTGAVVYDNQMGKDETGDDTTILGGGSIVIHDK
jgi:hypothetical protein